MTTATRTIDNNEDILDSRDIIARIEELETTLEEHHEAKETTLSFEYALQDAANFEGLEDEYSEYMTLKSLAEECEGYSSDWQYGETLIRRSYWVDYVEQMLKDCGDIPDNIPSYIAIDWNETAERIEVDYTTVDFDGVEYLIRSC